MDKKEFHNRITEQVSELQSKKRPEIMYLARKPSPFEREMLGIFWVPALDEMIGKPVTISYDEELIEDSPDGVVIELGYQNYFIVPYTCLSKTKPGTFIKKSITYEPLDKKVTPDQFDEYSYFKLDKPDDVTKEECKRGYYTWTKECDEMVGKIFKREDIYYSKTEGINVFLNTHILGSGIVVPYSLLRPCVEYKIKCRLHDWSDLPGDIAAIKYNFDMSCGFNQEGIIQKIVTVGAEDSFVDVCTIRFNDPKIQEIAGQYWYPFDAVEILD